MLWFNAERQAFYNTLRPTHGRVQGLGIVVWAFAKLGCDAACPAVMRLLGVFAAEALRRLEHPGGDPTMQLGAQSLSNLVRQISPLCLTQRSTTVLL